VQTDELASKCESGAQPRSKLGVVRTSAVSCSSGMQQ